MILQRTIIILAATAAASAQAQSGLAVSADVGTTGVGVHLATPLASNLDARVGFNYFKHGFDRRSGGLNYDADARLRTVDLLLDWYAIPSSRLRLTGGILYNGNDVTARARPDADGNYRINGRSYPQASVGTLDARADFRRAAPYIGIGWGNPAAADRGWSINGDLGAFYHGKGRVHVDFACAAGPLICPALANDVAAEQARLSDDLSDHKFFPVLRLGVAYRF